MSDITADQAQTLLARARINLENVEAEDYCCDAAHNQAVGAARKQVKRWETWLADRDVLIASA